MQERIMRKIEEIRKQPEHVRVWYAWASVAVVMFFVIVIWIFTLQENFRKAIPETVKQGAAGVDQLTPKADGSGSLEDLSKTGQSLGSDTKQANPISGSDYFNQELTKQDSGSVR
jgi:ABC-type phosphate/phosphonate transport system permease subunit